MRIASRWWFLLDWVGADEEREKEVEEVVGRYPAGIGISKKLSKKNCKHKNLLEGNLKNNQ